MQWRLSCLARHEAVIARAELSERTATRRPIRVHDLRATFITLALAAGRSETWVMDRTGHTTSAMLNLYRRQARNAAELHLGELAPLNLALPELATEALNDAQPDESLSEQLFHEVFQSERSANLMASDSPSLSNSCAREGSNLHALRRRNLNPRGSYNLAGLAAVFFRETAPPDHF